MAPAGWVGRSFVKKISRYVSQKSHRMRPAIPKPLIFKDEKSQVMSPAT